MSRIFQVYVVMERLFVIAQRMHHDSARALLEDHILDPLWSALTPGDRSLLLARTGTIDERNPTVLQVRVGADYVQLRREDLVCATYLVLERFIVEVRRDDAYDEEEILDALCLVAWDNLPSSARDRFSRGQMMPGQTEEEYIDSLNPTRFQVTPRDGLVPSISVTFQFQPTEVTK